MEASRYHPRRSSISSARGIWALATNINEYEAQAIASEQEAGLVERQLGCHAQLTRSAGASYNVEMIFVENTHVIELL